MDLPPDDRSAILQKTKEILWLRGDLNFKRHVTQQKMHLAWKESKGRQFFDLCSRRLGKSHELVLTAIETCIQRPGAQVFYLAPQGSDAVNIATYLMEKILEDCPREIRPEYSAQAKEYRFKAHGSVVRFKGTNGEHAKYLRGTDADLIILDEAALMDDLKHVIQDVCLPMTLTTGGRILVATTPARTPSHYSTELYERLARQNAVANYTLLDAVHLPYEVKVEALIEAGEHPDDIPKILAGEMDVKTTTAQREYFCKFVTDATLALVPEFDGIARKEIVKDTPIPPYRDCYVSMDVGARDKTGILFAYYDFIAGQVVIEDEALLTNPSTSEVAKVIKQKELMLWAQHGEIMEPYMRITDVDPRLVKDLSSLYGLKVTQADKRDGVLASVNFMKHAVIQRQLVIHPRCTNLVRQLTNAIWATSGKDMARAKEADSIDAHYDLVAALRYLLRGVNWGKNPYPAGFHRPPGANHVSYKIRKPADGFLKRRDTPIGRKLSGEPIYNDPFTAKPKKR